MRGEEPITNERPGALSPDKPATGICQTGCEVRQPLTALKPRERMMVLLDVATGLRQSELFALKWKDVDFENRQLCVTRSIVQQVVGNCKTEASQKTRTAPRLSDQCPTGLASQNTLSNAGELGVRQSHETRKNPILGTTNFFVTTSASRRKGWASQSALVGTHFAEPTRHFSGQRVRN